MFLNGVFQTGIEVGLKIAQGKNFFLLPIDVDFLETHKEAGASCFQERTRSITKSGQRLGSR